MPRSLSIAIAFIFIVGYISVTDRAAAVASNDVPRLYSLATEARSVSASEASSIASVREADIEFTGGANFLTAHAKLLIPLSDGVDHSAERYDIERRSDTDVTWRGKIGASGDVIITSRNGFVSGLIYGPRAVYEIVPRGTRHVLVELDQSRFPECGGGVDGGPGQKAIITPSLSVVDSGDRIDVIVVYTTATKNFLGGDAQAQALAQQAIDSTNTAYFNSRIRQRVRMVHTQEFVYTESGNASTDLANLRSNPSIQALRDTHKADLVAEISETTGVCGLGYLMTAQGGVVNNAFTVTVRSCAVGNLSFAHELGHNMGSHHNPENAGLPIFDYGFGHYVNGNYRTVMSYVDPCPSGCTRRPYFSNPGVIFNNFPTGTATRDNARMINTTADWVANYRYSGSSITMSSFGGGDWLPRIVERDLTWTSENVTGNLRIDLSRDEGTTWETIIPATPNDGSERVSISGRATRRARLRIVSLSNPTVSDSSVSNIGIR